MSQLLVLIMRVPGRPPGVLRIGARLVTLLELPQIKASLVNTTVRTLPGVLSVTWGGTGTESTMLHNEQASPTLSFNT